MYPDRVLLGVGTGESLNEVPVLGIEWPDSKERLARLKEAIELIHRLWTEDMVTFDGQFFHTRSATVYDKPKDPVPLYVAASGESAARLAGRVADGLIVTSGKGKVLYTETILPAFADGVKKAKRDGATLEKMVEVKVSFDRDRQRALEDTREWAALALPAEDKVGVEDPRELERRAAALQLEKAASRCVERSGRARGADRRVRRVRLHASRLPRARKGSDAPARAVRGRGATTSPGAARVGK